MTKKEEENQRKIEYLNSIVSEDIEYDNEKEGLVLGFIFNIITSDRVMNRYISTRYGNIMEGKGITIKEPINYIAKKLMELDNKKVEEENQC